jgi:hypothetical protein
MGKADKDKEDGYDLRDEYKKIQNQFELPEYKEVSDDFDIEKLSDKESEYLARDIRRTISEKLSGYMHFFELLINPASPPLFILSALRNIDKQTKDKLGVLYKKISKFQIESMKLDTIYKEDAEAKFINDVFLEWQSMKKEIYCIIDSLGVNMEEGGEERRCGYFG